MGRISKNLKALKAARAVNLAKPIKVKPVLVKKESSESVPHFPKQKSPKLLKAEKEIDPILSIRGMKIVKKRVDKDNVKRTILIEQLKNARRIKAEKNNNREAMDFEQEPEEEENEEEAMEGEEELSAIDVHEQLENEVMNYEEMAEVQTIACEQEKEIKTFEVKDGSRVVSDASMIGNLSCLTDESDSVKFKYNPNTTPRRKPPHRKSVYKARQVLQKQLETHLPGYEIVKKKEENSLLKDAKMIKLGKFSRSQVNQLSKEKKSPSFPTVSKMVDSLIPEVPQHHILDTSKRKNVIYLQFYDLLVQRLKNMKKIPSRRLRVSIAGDTGEKLTKITFYFNDSKNPQSCYNYTIFVVYEGDDSRENLIDILSTVEEDINKLLKEGVEINGIKYYFKFFLTGDLKFITSVVGCQGGNAKKFCCYCKSENYAEEGNRRSVQEIEENFLKIQHELKTTKKKENIIKQQNNSVCGMPLLPSIPLENICPPALHCCMALCNKLRLFSKSSKFDEFIKDLNIKPIQGRDEYNGNACRKILQKFRTKPQDYDGPNKKLFVVIANIELFAKAETLTEGEINLLSNLIKEFTDLLKEIPLFSIGTKIHCVLFHLMPFVHQELSWGIFSEQGMEAIHAKFTEFQNRRIAKKYGKLHYAFFEMLKITFLSEH